MANIHVSDLNIAGYDLLSDPESYLKELSEEEALRQIGGKPKTATATSLVLTGASTPVCMGALVSYTIWG